MNSMPLRDAAAGTGRKRMQRGFTLLELLVGIAIIGIVITLAAPSFRQFILMQRLKGINAQIVTDMQYARSEAVSRGVPVHVKVQPSDAEEISCYVIFTTTTPIISQSPSVASECDCTRAPGTSCTSTAATELRTVHVPESQSVYLNYPVSQPPNFAFDPRTGGIQIVALDFVGTPPTDFSIDAYLSSALKFRNTIGLAGRVKVCIPANSTLPGTAC